MHPSKIVFSIFISILFITGGIAQRPFLDYGTYIEDYQSLSDPYFGVEQSKSFMYGDTIIWIYNYEASDSDQGFSVVKLNKEGEVITSKDFKTGTATFNDAFFYENHLYICSRFSSGRGSTELITDNSLVDGIAGYNYVGKIDVRDLSVAYGTTFHADPTNYIGSGLIKMHFDSETEQAFLLEAFPNSDNKIFYFVSRVDFSNEIKYNQEISLPVLDRLYVNADINFYNNQLYVIGAADLDDASIEKNLFVARYSFPFTDANQDYLKHFNNAYYFLRDALMVDQDGIFLFPLIFQLQIEML